MAIIRWNWLQRGSSANSVIAADAYSLHGRRQLVCKHHLLNFTSFQSVCRSRHLPGKLRETTHCSHSSYCSHQVFSAGLYRFAATCHTSNCQQPPATSCQPVVEYTPFSSSQGATDRSVGLHEWSFSTVTASNHSQLVGEFPLQLVVAKWLPTGL